MTMFLTCFCVSLSMHNLQKEKKSWLVHNKVDNRFWKQRGGTLQLGFSYPSFYIMSSCFTPLPVFFCWISRWLQDSQSTVKKGWYLSFHLILPLFFLFSFFAFFSLLFLFPFLVFALFILTKIGCQDKTEYQYWLNCIILICVTLNHYTQNSKLESN